MGERETASEIQDQAIQWVVRMDRAGGDTVAHAELDRWLAADNRRRGAYFRAMATWTMLDRASVLRMQQTPDGAPPSQDVSRRTLLWWGGAAAASVAAPIAGIKLWMSIPTWIDTKVGEIRQLPLEDGSIAAINTTSRVGVSMREKERHVYIDRGEAWFQVAKDRKRPFLVEAGAVQVKALGTAFAVRRLSAGAEVLVTEGTVEVWSRGVAGTVRKIPAGGRTFVSDDRGPAEPQQAVGEIDRALAWRTGQLIFDGDPLWQAVADFNRYNAVKIVVDDPMLAQEQLVGRFHLNEPQAFANAVVNTLCARVDYKDSTIILARK